MIKVSSFSEVMLKDLESMSAMSPKRLVTPSSGNLLPTRARSLLAFVPPTLQQFTRISATFSVAKTMIIISYVISGSWTSRLNNTGVCHYQLTLRNLQQEVDTVLTYVRDRCIFSVAFWSSPRN